MSSPTLVTTPPPEPRAGAGRGARPTLRLVHHMARSGGTLISKCLGCMTGVLLLSESLRAELAEHHIGVTAICPGIVDTNIISATEFAGTSGDGQEQLRDKMNGMYRRRGFTPDRVATEILGAISANRAVVPVTVEAKVGYRVYRFVPGLSRRMARTNLV